MSRGAFRKLVVHYWACISVLLLHCHCQFYEPYEKLPLSSFESFNGTFDFPSGETQMFDEGADMTIRWTTEFLAVNLYVVYNASANPPSVGKQRQLSTGNSKTAIDWTISCVPDCEAPFAIKAVDAAGDKVALMMGGFWSRQFWIRPKSSARSSSSTTTSSTSSASTPTSDASTTVVSIPTSAPTPAPISTPTSTPTSIPASTPTSEPSSDSGSSDISNTTIIGASVGTTLGAVSIVCAAFYLWRRRSKNTSHAKTIDPSLEELHSLRSQDSKVPYASHHVVYEAPGWQAAEPQELPGRAM